MRVKGGVSPDVISIEPYMPIEGYVEIRVRENINEVSKDDGVEFEYAEYTFNVPDREYQYLDKDVRLLIAAIGVYR